MDRNLLTIKVIQEIKKKYNKEFVPAELEYINTKIKQLDQTLINSKSIDTLISVLSKVYINDLTDKNIKNRTEKKQIRIDMHDVINKELSDDLETHSCMRGIKKDSTIDSLLQTPKILQAIFNPSALKYETYLLLDRKFQAKDCNNINEFKWNISESSKNYDPKTTAITTIPLKHITSIKLYPFIFPNTLYAKSDIKRLSVEIVELNNQAYIAAAYNKRFHFALSVQNLSTDPFSKYNVDDVGNSECIYNFHDAIMELNTITLRFGNPFYNLNLDPDILPANITSVAAQTLLTFNKPHKLEAGDYVVIENFITSSPANDIVEINLINEKNGWPVVSLTTFTATIDVNLSGLTGTILNNPYNIYLESKRFIIRLKILGVN
jgi:hypothetical protein